MTYVSEIQNQFETNVTFSDYPKYFDLWVQKKDLRTWDTEIFLSSDYLFLELCMTKKY